MPDSHFWRIRNKRKRKKPRKKTTAVFQRLQWLRVLPTLPFAPHYRLLRLSASGGIRRAVLLRMQGKSRCRCQKIIASRQLASPNLTERFPQYAAQAVATVGAAQVAFGNTDGKTGVANIAGIIGRNSQVQLQLQARVWRVCSATTKKCRFFAVRAAPLPETLLPRQKKLTQTESSNRKFFAPFAAAGVYDGSAAARFHTRAKAMFAFAPDVGRLICAFHRCAYSTQKRVAIANIASIANIRGEYHKPRLLKML